MNISLVSVLVCCALFCGMGFTAWLGRRIGRRGTHARSESIRPVTSACFALLTLLTAFTVSGAANRMEMRRQLIVEETNAIRAFARRLDLVPADARTELRRLLAEYAEVRASRFEDLNDADATRRDIDETNRLQTVLWTRVVASAEGRVTPVLSACDRMFDAAIARRAAIQNHVPTVILGALVLLALSCAGFVGYGEPPDSPLSRGHVLGFALLTVMTFFLILDLEFPNAGFVRLDNTNRILRETADSLR